MRNVKKKLHNVLDVNANQSHLLPDAFYLIYYCHDLKAYRVGFKNNGQLVDLEANFANQKEAKAELKNKGFPIFTHGKTGTLKRA